ncbi:MAG: glycosyltransferase family 9 protein [Candidatus Omnitrophica bacterium]|nr:glycosyltransferase family 9 protein [Candidatus Omnitrophota bacterium]MBU1923223.1 glycosyltransferase family 9 protein [Candidatus Omnitrophota bacterium]
MINKPDLRVLIINPFGIGDVLFTTPVIKAVKGCYPSSFIAYWSNLRVKPILESNPQINKVFALSRGDLKKIYQESFFSGVWRAIKLASEIKREHFDICFDFSLDYRYSLFAKIMGIGKRIGFNYKGRGRFLTNYLDIDGYYNMHVVEYYLELLNFLDIPVCERKLFLDVFPGSELRAKCVLAASGIEENDFVIGIAPGGGGSWGKNAIYKHWSALRFAEVANKLIDKFKAKVIILGDESERDIAEVIVHSMRNKAINLMGKTGLEILPGIIKNCSLLIANDGGPMHMAVALGVKTVSVFGPVSETVYGPYPEDRNHVVLKGDVVCRPCYKNFRLPICEKDKECLKQVSADAVFDAVVRLLS